jgi:hypothetical protein
MRADRFELPLRIVVEDPVPGVAMALQRDLPGNGSEVVGYAEGAGRDLTFDLEVAVEGTLPDGRPRLLGPFVKGPPRERFVYLCVGHYAGQAEADWAGRMKVPIGEITWPLIEGLPAGARIEGHISGRGRNGGPALATVAILPPGWRYA